MKDYSEIGAVLSYRTSGINSITGQVVGMDGSGQFSVLIIGNPQEAEFWAINYIKELHNAGYIIQDVILVINDKDIGYFGSPISIMNIN